MKAYNLKEVSKVIGVPPSVMKQWEKDLENSLVIPRTKQGARYYTEKEVEMLVEIKHLYQFNKNKEIIRTLWRKKLEVPVEVVTEPVQSVLPAALPDQLPPKEANADPQILFEVMDAYKQTFLDEVKDEIRSVVQKEVVDEMKKEISKGMLHTVKSISNSIYKTNAATQGELEHLKDSVGQVLEQNAQTHQVISDRIESHALETSEEIFTLSKQLAQTSEELTHYIDVTNNGLDHLTDAIVNERENYKEDLEQFRHEIRQREAAFQTMLSGFRDAAPAKEKKWWQLW